MSKSDDITTEDELHEIERELRSFNEFLGITSHELRTLLTTIKGNIQLARMRLSFLEQQLHQVDPALKGIVDEIHSMLNRADQQVNAQNRLIHDLLDLTNIQRGEFELILELNDLTDIVISAVEDQRSTFPSRTMHLQLPGQQGISIQADAERIRQVLRNYVANALKFSTAEKPIVVTLELRGDSARVAVRDEGPGLTRLEQRQVWKRFYKVKGMPVQKGFSQGLGLGLYICKTVIEGHHGEVGVESIKGVGSTFWFTLPLASAAQNG